MKKLIFAILIFMISISAFSQIDNASYSIKSSNKTVIIPLFYHATGGYYLYAYPCFTAMSYNNNDTLTLTGSYTTGDSTGFPIALKKWSADSLFTSGIIYFAQRTKAIEHQFMPYTPIVRYLILKANATISDTIYIKTLFQR